LPKPRQQLSGPSHRRQNITASIDAYRTQQAATVTQIWIDGWTATPTPTNTPVPTSTPDLLQTTLEPARSFSGNNLDWTL